jgi:hypothetical protein
MFSGITKVEKIDANTLVLHADKGRPHKLVKGLTMFRFEGRDISILSRSDYESSARTHGGQELGSFIATAEYVRTQSADPFFDVKAVNTTSVIAFKAQCEDTFYGFEQEAFIGQFKSIHVAVHRGSPTRSILHPITDKESDFSPQGDPLLQLDVIVAEEEFRALFNHFWISPTPGTVSVTISLPCFEHPGAGLAPSDYGDDVVLEANKLVPAQLESIHVEKHLLSVSEAKTRGADEPSLLTAPSLDDSGGWETLKSYTQQIAQSVKRIEMIVAAAAGVVIVVSLFKT